MRRVLSRSVLALLAVGVLAACGSSDGGSDGASNADSPVSTGPAAVGDGSVDAQCEELLPARTVADTTGEPLILHGASAEELGAEDVPWDWVCGYVSPGVSSDDFVAAPDGPVMLYYITAPDPADVENYDTVVEIGGLPAGVVDAAR